MIRYIQLGFLLLIVNIIHSQDCYKSTSLNDLSSDFSSLWLDKTFQGTIGEKNQRIEIRFTDISKAHNQTYLVRGKSKVNSNICDFDGQIRITDIKIVDPICEGPDYSYGILTGVYSFREDSTQNHVGEFNGTVNTKYNKTDSEINPFTGWYSDEGVNVFHGDWKEYHKTSAKYCSWGLQIPPTKRKDLFKHYDNEAYLFNYEFIDRGWRSYVLSNLGIFLTIPKEFNTDEPRYSDDFIENFSSEEIDKNKNIEKTEWWK